LIARALFEKGLFQVGHFVVDGIASPYRLQLSMLPSYPALMSQIVDAMAVIVGQDDCDFLLSTPDASALAGAVSVQAKIPLVHSRGRGEKAVFDLVGAYDVGHPSCLVTYTTRDADIRRVIEAGQQTGLEVRRVVAILDAQADAIFSVPVSSLVTLSVVVDELARDGLLPAQQAQAIRGFIRRPS
jgi:orotate phosphoribosyltransferase